MLGCALICSLLLYCAGALDSQPSFLVKEDGIEQSRQLSPYDVTSPVVLDGGRYECRVVVGNSMKDPSAPIQQSLLRDAGSGEKLLASSDFYEVHACTLLPIANIDEGATAQLSQPLGICAVQSHW